MDLRPTPDEIKEGAIGLRIWHPNLYPEDARAYATRLMVYNPSFPRIRDEITRLEAKINILMSEVSQWMCPGCNSVYSELPGPADNAMTRFRCSTPGCNSDVGLMNAMRLRKEREDRRAERIALENQVAAYSTLAASSAKALEEIYERESSFLEVVAEKAHWTHDPPHPWQQCQREPCKMIREAIQDFPQRPEAATTPDERQEAREAYERAVGRG